MNSLLIAITAGLSFGIVLGYRIGKAIFLKIAGPYARSRLLIALSVGGGIFFIIPASVFAVFIARNLVAESGGGLDHASMGMLIGIAVGTGIVVASGLVVAASAGAVSARFIENVRTWWS